KIILVRGSIPDTSAALDSRIYFDQNGVLSKRFGLTAVPARITPAPSGERLNIEVFPVRCPVRFRITIICQVII
ncbi:hypothetical protein GR646_27300, partial [Klebsiella pneumoniae]|nr:hypothetical protein [Klebsiella pneumoniae]